MLKSEQYMDEIVCQDMIDAIRESLGKGKPLYGNDPATVKKTYLALVEKEKETETAEEHKSPEKDQRSEEEKKEQQRIYRREWYAKNKSDPQFMERQRVMGRERTKAYQDRQRKKKLENEKEEVKEEVAETS